METVLRRTVCLVCLPVLYACATSWRNPGVPPHMQQQQLAIANGYCKQVSVGSAPMPSVNIPAPVHPPAYRVNGYGTTTYDSGRVANSSFNATVTPYQSPAQSFADGLTSGAASGAALGVLMRAKRDQDEIYRGCMFGLGWIPE